MSLGTAIFASSLVIALAIIFVSTKDRWNWKRVSIWAAVICVTLPLLAIAGVYAYSWYESRPTPQAAFWDVPIGAIEGDVKFLKGAPQSFTEKGNWKYNVDAESGSAYVIEFQDGRVRAVVYFPNEEIYAPYLLGITAGDSSQKIIDTLGPASDVSVSSDELRRWMSYQNYSVAFALRENKVEAYGVYDTKFGPMTFNEGTKSAPTSGAK